MRKYKMSLKSLRLVFIFLFVCFFNRVNSQSFQSSNLPIIVINTQGAIIQDEPKIIADIGIIDNGVGNTNNITDPYNNFNGKVGIEIRGSSSQMFPKKQYGIELRDLNGIAIDTSLLGLPAESDWILFAPYNDKSLIRDVLAYKIAQDMGHYAPRTRYCEVVINGEYMGIYVLLEKIKRDKNRVDINKLNPDENSGDDLTGGYIIKIDKQTGDTDKGWNSAYPPLGGRGSKFINFLYEYPDPADITTQQREYIKNYIGQFEFSLKSQAFADPVDGYSKYIDINSFIDFFIVNEVSKNVDGYRLSTYLHKQRNSDGGKLIMGPVWDFNLGFGNADYCTAGSPDGMVLAFNSFCPDDYWLIPFWWNRFLQDATFARKLTARWSELRTGKLRTEVLTAYIDSTVTVLNMAQQRNFQRWPVLGQYVWPNYYVGSSFPDEIFWLKNWITQRMNWLDGTISGFVTDVTDVNDPVAISQASITAFPNPAAENFQFQVIISKPGKIRIVIYDGFGQKAEEMLTHYPSSGTFNKQLGSRLSQGSYYYRIEFDDNFSASGKLQKK